MPWLRPIGINNIDVSKAFALLGDTSKSSQELNMKLVKHIMVKEHYLITIFLMQYENFILLWKTPA